MIFRWVKTHRFCDVHVDFAKVQGFNPRYIKRDSTHWSNPVVLFGFNDMKVLTLPIVTNEFVYVWLDDV